MESISSTTLRTYPAPWRGELLLACAKCQKKFKKAKSFGSLKKWFKKQAKAHAADAPSVRVAGIGCIKMCPKGGITIARQRQLADAGAEVSILRSEADLQGLYTLIAQEQMRDKLLKSA